MKILVAIAGLGDFGTQIAEWIDGGRMKDVAVGFCVEPKPTQHRSGVPCYRSWSDVSPTEIERIQVVVDCASQGRGPENLALYRNLGLSAVFQNGEGVDLCDLFHTNHVFRGPVGRDSSYLKITRCSALAACAVIEPIMDIASIKSAWVNHYKVNDRDRMLDMNYASGVEVERLLGIETRVDVVYLRGTSHRGYAYHGVIHLECPNPPNRAEVLDALERGTGLALVSQDIDVVSCTRVVETLVIKEGVDVHGGEIRITVLSFTPEINFPQNESAIRLLANPRLGSS